MSVTWLLCTCMYNVILVVQSTDHSQDKDCQEEKEGMEGENNNSVFVKLLSSFLVSVILNTTYSQHTDTLQSNQHIVAR